MIAEDDIKKGDGLCAYVFINNGEDTMTISDAIVNGRTHGLFGAYAGELIVNSGTYTLDGNGGLGCYVAYSNGNYFNAAVDTGYVVVNNMTFTSTTYYRSTKSKPPTPLRVGGNQRV